MFIMVYDALEHRNQTSLTLGQIQDGLLFSWKFLIKMIKANLKPGPASVPVIRLPLGMGRPWF